jgi:Exonuclease
MRVDRDTIEALVKRGLLPVAGRFNGWPLYGGDALDAVDIDVLAAVVDEIRVDRLLTGREAAALLEIRESDFQWLLAGDLLAARTHRDVQVLRRHWVAVPLYRTGDVEALRTHPDIDWEAVWSTRPGRPSPLRELAHRPVDRAAAVRRWVAELGARYGIEVWCWWNPSGQRWEIDWERVDGAPDPAEVEALIAAHPWLARWGEFAVSSEAGSAVRWARAMREPGAAVILDFETTDLDGYAVEIAVVDAATGDTLLNTLVNPQTPISAGAHWVHGLSDDDVVGAPLWVEVLPQLLAVTAGRTVLAYNAGFDAAVAQRHTARDGLELGHLADQDRWACLMDARSAWLLTRRWLPLGGRHRALGDCQAAYELLCAMTAPARQPKRRR